MACQSQGSPKGGACRLSRTALAIMPAASACMRGPSAANAAPSGAGPSGPAGQSASSAPLRFQGRCGVSPHEGVGGDDAAAPAQGKTFPVENSAILFLLCLSIDAPVLASCHGHGDESAG